MGKGKVESYVEIQPPLVDTVIPVRGSIEKVDVFLRVAFLVEFTICAVVTKRYVRIVVIQFYLQIGDIIQALVRCHIDPKGVQPILRVTNITITVRTAKGHAVRYRGYGGEEFE